MQRFFLFLITMVAFHTTSLAFTKGGENGEDIDSSDVATEETTVSFYDTAAIYTDDWNNNVTFWYPEFDYQDSSVLSLTGIMGSYTFPVEKATTSGFGRRHSSYHKGIDIPLKTGDTVVAAFDGKVRYAKWNSGGFGNLVIVRHPNGMETYYAHLSRIKVKPNQVIKAGELLGLGGSTGRSYSPHLHFEMRYNHKAFDPEMVFDLENYCLKNEEVIVKELYSHAQHTSKGNFRKSTADLSTGTVYTIRSGDTLSKIAGKYGTTVEALCKLNGMSRTTILQIGQKVRVK